MRDWKQVFHFSFAVNPSPCYMGRAFFLFIGYGAEFLVLDKRKNKSKSFIWIKRDDVEEGGSFFTNAKHSAGMV